MSSRLRNALGLSTLLLSPLTLMCSSPSEPGGHVRTPNRMSAATTGSSGADGIAGGGGSVTVVPGAGGGNGRRS